MFSLRRPRPAPKHALVSHWRKTAALAVVAGLGTSWLLTYQHGAASRAAAAPVPGSTSTSSTAPYFAAPPVVAAVVTRESTRRTSIPRVAVSTLLADGIPTTAYRAYVHAAALAKVTDPGCGVAWPLLAGIGRIESDHGRFAGAVLRTNGLSTPRVIGIALDGHGTALIRDTDRGLLDGDRVYDRAVGPMQFIPSTWARFAEDGNADGIADPFNIFDAATAAAHYLCVAGGDLASFAGQHRALLAYNHSEAYFRLVFSVERAYARAAHLTLVATPEARPAAPKPRPVPPVDPGPPSAVTRRTPNPPSATSSAPSSSAPESSSTSDPSLASPSSASSSSSDSPSSAPSSSDSSSPSPSDSPSGAPSSTQS